MERALDDWLGLWARERAQPARRLAYDQPVLSGHTTQVNTLVAAPDGSWLAAAEGDGTIRLWDPRTGLETAELPGHTGAIRAASVAPDGSWLASAGRDNTLRIWDLPATSERAVVRSDTGWVNALAIPPDGSLLATASNDGTVRIWDPQTSAERAAIRVDGPLLACCWLAEPMQIAVGGAFGLYLFDLVDGPPG